MKQSPRQPSLYIPHGGGPCFFMEWTQGPQDTWDNMGAWLRGIPDLLPEPPRALLVISAHWEASEPTVTSASHPPLIYDYSGFPPHTYELKWPAPGSRELAKRIVALLAEAAIVCHEDRERGFDHGVFIPLLLAFPQAEIPTVQLSLQAGLDPGAHLAMGRALAPLRDEGVLLIGSGLSFHNMRSLGSGTGKAASRSFDEWLGSVVGAPIEKRDAELFAWKQAPSARDCHPREEHLLPLMVAAGAGGDELGEIVFRDNMMGFAVSAARFG